MLVQLNGRSFTAGAEWLVSLCLDFSGGGFVVNYGSSASGPISDLCNLFQRRVEKGNGNSDVDADVVADNDAWKK